MSGSRIQVRAAHSPPEDDGWMQAVFPMQQGIARPHGKSKVVNIPDGQAHKAFSARFSAPVAARIATGQSRFSRLAGDQASEEVRAKRIFKCWAGISLLIFLWLARRRSGQAETNVKRIVALLVAIVALTWPGRRVRAESSAPPSVGGSSVVLINQGDQSLNFAFRPADGKWAVYSVGPGKSTTLSCDHCTVPYFEFSITTEGHQVNYRLMPAESYLLYWNRDQHRWDLSHPETQ